MTKKTEVLLPVGDREMALAAIHNGADAVFLGVPGFNARGRSQDFDIETLKELIELCHLYGVKVNLAFNILIFEEELELALQRLREILPLRPDALIVQDLGLVRLIRQWAPLQRVHASTQMTVTNAETIRLLEDLNIQRFVLGRENSMEEISAIRARTDRELEVFVHGALCVSYSGQCFTSESIGGRSANRGQCAQSCRFGYELYVDDVRQDLGSRQYLVSPKDLCGLDEVADLVARGVDCLKVEGRLKTPEYVAVAAQAYRQAVDQATVPSPSTEAQRPSQSLHRDHSSLASWRPKLETTYSRGFFSGWLKGVNHQQLVDGTFSAHRGHAIGKVIGVEGHDLRIEVQSPSVYQELEPGDGLLWVNVSQREPKEEGGFVYAVQRLENQRLRVTFSRDKTFSASVVGATVYQNHSRQIKKQTTQSWEDRTQRKQIGVLVQLEFLEGQPLRARVFDGQREVLGETSCRVERATKQGVTDEQLESEWGALGGTPFKLDQFSVHRDSQEALFIPHREIKKLRQETMLQLTERRKRNEGFVFQNQGEAPGDRGALKAGMSAEAGLRFNLLLRDRGQVEDLISALERKEILGADIDSVILDFEFGRDYHESCEKLRANKLRVGLATTRILKPQEHRHLKILAGLKPDVILVRNLGALSILTEELKVNCELQGDFSLNVTNHLTADYLFGKGLSSLCASYDLNHTQLSQLLRNSVGQKMEVTLTQSMPSFHMEHCVFAAFLSQGSSYRDCGRPCEKHQVQLKDQFGHWHHIKADQECRNTMFNAKAQTAARYLSEWRSLGLGAVRYEALKERGTELISKVKAHIDFLKGAKDLQIFLNEIDGLQSYGLSEGQWGRTREYKSLKKNRERTTPP